MERLRPSTCDASSDEDEDVRQGDMQKLLTTKPHDYKRCKLVIERHDKGHAIPFDEPTLPIRINGRDHLCRSFSGETVCVEILSREGDIRTGRVEGVMERKSFPFFICKMVEGDPSLMTPIRKPMMTRIYIPQLKRPNTVKNRGRVQTKLADTNPNDLFLVKVLKWKSKCFYPLGEVTKVLPPESEELNNALDIEYGLGGKPPSLKPRHTKSDTTERKDFCDCLTFTIDSPGAEDLDDAISVTDLGETFQIAVHITDVASCVPKGSEADKFARDRGETFYGEDKTSHMFDRDLSFNHLSLLQGKKRNAISLLVSVSKQTHEIVSSDFALSRIQSGYQLSYQDAEKYIQNHLSRAPEPLQFSSVEHCVVVAYRFSEMHRVSRLAGGVSRVQCDRDRSHCMVEELMNMYNSEVANYLTSSPLTRDLTPLRCHGPPDPEPLLIFSKKYQTLIPLSPFLSQLIVTEESDHELNIGNLEGSEDSRDDEEEDSGEDEGESKEVESVESDHQEENDENSHSYESDQEELDNTNIANFDTNNQPLLPQEFEVFNGVVKKLEEAIRNRDQFTLLKLMASDHIHPTLISVEREFRELLSQAEILRSCSTPKSRMGHFDLQLDSYTRASDPMRRYVDIILQRLLHCVLCGEIRDTGYTQAEIDQFCALHDFDQASDYTLHVKMLTQLNKQCAVHMAFVHTLHKGGHNFWFSFPLTSTLGDLSILYRHLKVVDQPEYNKEQNTMTLHWKRRVYSFTNTEKNPVKTLGSKYTTCTAVDTWQKMMSAVQNQNWDEAEQCLDTIRADSKAGENERMNAETDEHHFKKLSLELRLGKVLPVQIGMGPGRTPEVHLINLSPEFEVCLEHSKRPTTCFSKLALYPSKSVYEDYKEYQKIWTPLCKMDTAHNALEENNSVILEGVELTWTSAEQNDLKGYFRISETKKKLWAIEFDLTDCFLCIRLRNQDAEADREGGKSEQFVEFSLQDPLPFTWVAHGVASRPKKKKKKERDDPKPTHVQVNFYINHHSMNYTPPQVFHKNTKFTVEVIPKKIPYVLQENAVANLKCANHLVQSIAVGDSLIHSSNIIQVAAKSSMALAAEGQKLGLPSLNPSQMNAVKEALQRPFTLIQGPPGTGKTVVGVHIVHQFFQRNQQDDMFTSNSETDSNTDSPPKKRAILYCGPSNKSVDIVAEQLLKLHKKGVLKPMRVHSEQMEMLEFPYPGSELKLCKKSHREEKPKGELRSISLMYEIRNSKSNPFSEKINRFEESIKDGSFTEDEIQGYKDVLRKAKLHELRNQDVILCTCAAALNPNFIKVMDFRQILIDECAMATEPEAFIPLVSHNPKQIVLLGDHKQLRPIVECPAVKEMGKKRSLFERYMDKALMLDTQYRMHEGICKFPSAMFYEGRLKTAAKRQVCYLMTKEKKATPILFGHVDATEDSLVVSTTTGNENSKANPEEAAQAVRIAGLLIKNSKISPDSIAILTPYNAQVSEITTHLKSSHIENVTVCTIMKSQGSEWPYVILSTVRSCEPSVLKTRPIHSKSWEGKHMGFITDPNQVNVAITRAQDGLCILGNRHLLRCNKLWDCLLTHYQKQGCVVDPAKDIQIRSTKGTSALD
ncbi:helicase with zinc finger domain 2-like [Alosa sapidissima]|uniref:helicase with zinc finger domain 2-like n=1 Tax=Alosa sapidissima TaxID=34773 RepID=UPI001C092FF5|nr:helicase with zinc finger domain 2-like [Alosa sapidissima]